MFFSAADDVQLDFLFVVASFSFSQCYFGNRHILLSLILKTRLQDQCVRFNSLRFSAAYFFLFFGGSPFHSCTACEKQSEGLAWPFSEVRSAATFRSVSRSVLLCPGDVLVNIDDCWSGRAIIIFPEAPRHFPKASLTDP